MMKLILEYYDKAVSAHGNGAPLNALINLPERESIGRFKYLTEDKIEEEYKKLSVNVAAAIDNITEKEDA